MTQFSNVAVELRLELDILKADYADCNRERIRWKTIADNQLNALTGAQELIDLLAANCSDRVRIDNDPRWGIVCHIIDKAVCNTERVVEQSGTAAADTSVRAGARSTDPVCTDCGGSGVTYQTERRCSCQPVAPAQPAAQQGNGD